MSNQLSAMLGAWHKDRTGTEWVLGTIYKTEGSAYRKAGAMMMINGRGEQFGLLSGGCLEADIIRNARRAMVSEKTVKLVYDGNDEDDLSFRLGVGCGGTVYIMLQPVTVQNDLGLADLCAALHNRQSGFYRQQIDQPGGYFSETPNVVGHHAHVEGAAGEERLVTPIRPEPHILLVGGGLDARPVVHIAREMGWQVSLADPRPANARAEHFSNVAAIFRTLNHDLASYVNTNRVDAAILMSHSIPIDGKALNILASSSVRHVSALGPAHRFEQVLGEAGLARAQLPFSVQSPAGLPLGGELPESIALSMLAGIHQALHALYTKADVPVMVRAAE
ncbi:XdhC family protein [Thalassospira mesophila]|uniref:Xanthine dehydrogenase n=1 Tax=Thalassospira mesophila TaxID=1293891 RepID=A0A1Y2KXB5_9PROT|nr:XdhC family protein [Thalassospira mesophila]OSQ36752.1 xanthine dehydrogenase [Thalassospira mesophila]